MSRLSVTITHGVALLGLMIAPLMAHAEPASPVGSWQVVRIGDQDAVSQVKSRLRFAADGTVTGTGGCNRLRAHATITDERLSFGPIISTRIACFGAAMQQESAVLTKLEKVKNWHRQGDVLVLSDENKKTVLILTRSD